MLLARLRSAVRARPRNVRRLSDAARAALVRAPVVDDDGTHHRTTVIGAHPVRVLLFGSGPLVGYGVRQRSQAVDGVLAQLIADGLGRGVTIESRVGLSTATCDAVRSLGGAGTATFSLAIWAPRFGEEMTGARRARADLRSMLQEFREQSAIPLVVCELPVPLGDDWRTRLRRPRVVRYNAGLAALASAADGVTAAPAGVYEPSSVATSLGPEWHRAFAALVAPAALATMAELRQHSL